jgi:hypothetical protein
MYLRITFIGSTNFLCFPATTGRRLQPPSFLGYNLRESPTPQFSGYNQKEVTTAYVLQLQLEGVYNQKEDTTPYVLQLQLKGGYNHMFFPHPAALTYK